MNALKAASAIRTIIQYSTAYESISAIISIFIRNNATSSSIPARILQPISFMRNAKSLDGILSHMNLMKQYEPNTEAYAAQKLLSGMIRKLNRAVAA